MKRVLLLITLAGALSAGGCAEGWFEGNEVGDHLQKGMSGEGQLGPIDRPAGDQADEHGVPTTHP
jgi:hypothetical protein